MQKAQPATTASAAWLATAMHATAPGAWRISSLRTRTRAASPLMRPTPSMTPWSVQPVSSLQLYELPRLHMQELQIEAPATQCQRMLCFSSKDVRSCAQPLHGAVQASSTAAGARTFHLRSCSIPEALLRPARSVCRHPFTE